MLGFKEVIERIKDLISLEVGERRVLDAMVANALKMSPENLANHKRKNVVPLQKVAVFCARRKVSINWMLFDQSPKFLKEDLVKRS